MSGNWFGYYVQALSTGVGPTENLTAHLANAFATNVLRPLDGVAMLASSGVKAWYGVDRKQWIHNNKTPEHLTGEFAGDYGFDPLNLATDADPVDIPWLFFIEPPLLLASELPTPPFW